ncbi:PDZ domain-containing protein [Nitrospira defluvii]|nr:PDZ domain-containing protein [Nitrospira defluvii]
MQKPSNILLIGLIFFQWVVAGWLGIVVQDLTPQMAMRYGLSNRDGAIVTRVQFGSPAMKGGLLEGDLIISLGGEKIQDAKALKKTLSDISPGSRIDLVIIRNRQEEDLEITLGAPPRNAA